MPGAVPGFCNLECWCHVPTRGVHKPPCYLCVIDCCSLSSKKEAAPSAPSLTALEDLEPPHIPSPNVESDAQINNTINLGGQQLSRVYGWRETLHRRASLGATDQEIANNQNFFSETYIHIPPEQVNAQSVPEIPGPPEETENSEGVYIPEPDYEATSQEVPVDSEETHENSGEIQAAESESKFVTRVKVNSSPDGSRQVDLTELLRNVMIDPQEPSEDEDEDEDRQQIQNRPGVKHTLERSISRRRRDRNQVDKYQSFYNAGAKPYLIARPSFTRQQSLNETPSEPETEFQRLHKIHRRDTSSDAARRYLQSDENLHRTWWKQVSSRKRNCPRRNSSSKRHDGYTHRSLTNLEDVWRS